MQTLFDHLASLADPTRSRLLLALDRHELTVGELCAVLQLPQSTVSRHLKQLDDAAWVESRADGTRRLYRAAEHLDQDQKKLWHVVRDQFSTGTSARRDAERVAAVLARRRTTSEEFFATSAGQWDALRTELFGEYADLRALPALLDSRWVVGDLGCGTGRFTELIAPFVARVIAVDTSRSMLAVARKRLAGRDNVVFERADLESIPCRANTLDAAVVFLALHHVTEPPRVFSEIMRALKSGGRALIVDMQPHDRAEYRERMGHVWQGFAEAQISEWMQAAGFSTPRYQPLAIDSRATGPALFAASARKSA